MYLKENLLKFADDLAAKLPAPGGGSATALVGALSSALNSMVVNYTVDNEKFKENERINRDILESSEKLRMESIDLVQKDIDVYTLVSTAYKMPKNTVEEKSKREDAIQKALKEASKVPLRVFEISIEILKISRVLLKFGNPNLISDVGVAACLADAVLKSSIINIEVNLKNIKDNDFSNAIRRRIKDIEAEGNIIKEEVWLEVLKKLNV